MIFYHFQLFSLYNRSVAQLVQLQSDHVSNNYVFRHLCINNNFQNAEVISRKFVGTIQAANILADK